MNDLNKASPAALALDLTGLFLAPISRTPRGIDRVELAYARHFIEHWSGKFFAILPPPWGCVASSGSVRVAFLEPWKSFGVSK